MPLRFTQEEFDQPNFTQSQFEQGDFAQAGFAISDATLDRLALVRKDQVRFQQQAFERRQFEQRTFTLGDRLPITGQWQAVPPSGAPKPAIKLGNGVIPKGDRIELYPAQPTEAFPAPDIEAEIAEILSLSNCRGYLNGQVFNCPDDETINPGFLFLFVNDGQLFAGGLFARRMIDPSAPSRIQATGRNPRSFDLSWIDNSGEVAELRRYRREASVSLILPQFSGLYPVGGGVWRSQYSVNAPSISDGSGGSSRSGQIYSALVLPGNQVLTATGTISEVIVRSSIEGTETNTTSFSGTVPVFDGIEYSYSGSFEYFTETSVSVSETSSFEFAHVFAYDVTANRAIACRLSVEKSYEGVDGEDGSGVAAGSQVSSTEYFVCDREGTETPLNTDTFLRLNLSSPSTPATGSTTFSSLLIELPYSDYTYSLNYPGDSAPGSVLDYATISGGDFYSTRLINCPCVWAKRNGATVLKGIGSITAYTVTHPVQPQTITSITVSIDEVITVPFDGFATENGTIYTNNGSIHGVLQAANINDRLIVAGGRLNAVGLALPSSPLVNANSRSFTWKGASIYTSYPSSAINSPTTEGFNYSDRWRSQTVDGAVSFFKDVTPTRGQQLRLNDSQIVSLSTGTFIPV